jgi:hypothetical protein
MTRIQPSTVVATLFATVVTAVVLTGSHGSVQAGSRAVAAKAVVELPRVVVTGKVQRSAPVVAELPRVVVIGRKSEDRQTVVGQAVAARFVPLS